MNRRATDTLRSLAALAALLALVVVPPVALARFVGWPLPTSLPSMDAITAATRSGVDDMVIVKIIACLAWIIWLQLAVAAIAEIAAVGANRSTPRVPALPAAQKGMHRLVVAAAALFIAGVAAQRTASLPTARLAAVVARPTAQAAIPVKGDASATPTTTVVGDTANPAPAQAWYETKHNDSWWHVAELTLGDGSRWKELRAANAGRTMPDGAVITATTEMLEPGWPLAIPGAAHSMPRVDGVEEDIVQPRGDHLWAMAERNLQHELGRHPTDDETHDYWRKLIAANLDRLADPNRPDRVYAGQHMRLPNIDNAAATSAAEPAPLPTPPVPPATPAPHESATTVAPVPTQPPVTVAAPSLPRANERADANAADSERATPDDEQRAPTGMLGMAGTMLAVAISGEVLRRRRRRQLHLPPGTKPSPPPTDLDEIRVEVSAMADVDHATRLHSALRDVAGALADRRSEARPRLVQATGNRTEVLLSQPVVPPPPGWRAEASGTAWVLDGAPPTQVADDTAPAPTPTLVGLGRATDDGAELHLDLEAEGVVALTGEPAAVADLARSWLLELATSPLAAGSSIVVVGDDTLAPRSSDRVRVVEQWDDIADDVVAYITQSTGLLAANRWPSPCAGRMRTPRADDLAPLAVFLSEQPASDTFAAAARMVLDGAPAVTFVIIGHDIDGAARVDVTEDTVRVPSLGLTCGAQAVTAMAAEQIEELLDDASREPVQLELIPRPPTPPPVAVGSARDEYQDPPFEVLVRLLGDIAVVGGSRKLKPKQTAVVAYIALHTPVSAEKIEDAVWVAPTSSRHKRLANTVSESRSALGANHLPVAVDGRYRVGPAVVTDLDLFERRIAYAAQQEDAAAMETLRGALELVEGPVFTYRNADRVSYVWVDVENWHSDWELNVTEAAEDLARRYLDAGDIDGATWAARRGLLASSTDPRLTKVLIQAHFANGDLRAAEQVFESHQAALEALALDDVDPELVDYYQQARRGRGAAAS